MFPLDENELTAVFEKLVSEGVIMYEPYSVAHRENNGYPIELRHCPSLKRKPHDVNARLDSNFDLTRKWGPGSDLYLPDERLIVRKINNTHDIALNMFAVDKPQLMMTTMDSYRRQDAPLDRDDFEMLLQVLNELGNFYVIYNCSAEGGCSRTHKHMQGLRGPPYAFDFLIRSWMMGDLSKVPFQYFAHHFRRRFADLHAKEVLDVYHTLLTKTRKILGLNETQVCPHNVVMWKDWILVLARTKSHVGKASTNAAGMLGSVWLSEEHLVEEWKKIGCANALRGLGLPS
ncbi:hypothetical protein CC80DRAFT_541951 [Byssothecium circinans]|uniref:Uncharacterized protein n=1 Tax=Byssothecium circinans TaxID=147558 RepID=A0A6A5UEQ4_9PLEO|nr:hypothetical protein CC80DRAFT_541951 [Byssothecium circinans]